MASLIQWTRHTIRDVLPLTLTERDGTALNLGSLQASAITVKLRQQPYGPWFAIAGAAQIINAAAGQITVTFAAGDVQAKGLFRLRVEVNFGNGSLWDGFEADFSIQ